MEDEGLPFPGSDFFELITAYQIRIRSIVIRIRIRHTAIRIRIVVPAIDHTDYWGTLPLAKLLI